MSSVTRTWRDPRLRPEGVPLRQLLEDMGYSPQQQARILAERPAGPEVPVAEPDALPDPTPAQLPEAARIDAERRKRAEELEGRNAWLVAGLLRAEVVADGRLWGFIQSRTR